MGKLRASTGLVLPHMAKGDCINADRILYLEMQ